MLVPLCAQLLYNLPLWTRAAEGLPFEYCALEHKFTMEMGRDGHLSFFDTDIYRRPDDSLGHRLCPSTPPSIQTQSSITTQPTSMPCFQTWINFFWPGKFAWWIWVIQGHFQTEQLHHSIHLTWDCTLQACTPSHGSVVKYTLDRLTHLDHCQEVPQTYPCLCHLGKSVMVKHWLT
jgi:hypothetical protein